MNQNELRQAQTLYQRFVMGFPMSKAEMAIVNSLLKEADNIYNQSIKH